MLKVRYALGLALLMAASLYLLPALQAADNPVPDSPEVSGLLAQAKTRSIQLRDDSDLMRSFNLTGTFWQNHADQITMIKSHVNNLGKLLREMDSKREMASPWQQEAIDHITPLAAELASSVENTIEHLNTNQNRLHTPQYRDYLTANYNLSVSLSALIGDFVSYGKNRAEYEKLGSELELPGS
ncbi:MAG: hypothetical protein P8Z30_16510 [Acidobacteriota bacterium]